MSFCQEFSSIELSSLVLYPLTILIQAIATNSSCHLRATPILQVNCYLASKSNVKMSFYESFVKSSFLRVKLSVLSLWQNNKNLHSLGIFN